MPVTGLGDTAFADCLHNSLVEVSQNPQIRAWELESSTVYGTFTLSRQYRPFVWSAPFLCSSVIRAVATPHRIFAQEMYYRGLTPHPARALVA